MGCCPCFSASAIDPIEAANKVREEAPEILLDGEEFKFAFAFTRDQIYFSNYRILRKDKQGFTGSSVSWQSIPYTAIKAFSVQTAGTLDFNMEMCVWPSGIKSGEFESSFLMGSQGITVSFKKNGGVDVFALQCFLNEKVFNPSNKKVELPPAPESMDDGAKMSYLDLIMGDARAIDPKVVEAQLKVDPPILLPDETIDMAFRCGRDTTCLTSRRVLYIDVKGITGKKVHYMSYHWSAIKAFAVETPGAFIDRDSTLKLWTTIGSCWENCFSLDLRNSSVDILQIQRYFADKILGQDTAPPSAEANKAEGQQDEGGGWKAWLCGDMRMLDAVQENIKFHEQVPILQGCETLEMAFKGARDMVLFTTKRMILIDPQGITGKKVSYTSLPWDCVQAFAVQSAGSMLDKDSEMTIWTDIFHDYHTEEQGDDDNKETIYLADPGLSCISVDFDKSKVDLCAVNRYLTSRCATLGSQSSQPAAPVDTGVLAASQPGAIEGFLHWIGDNYRQVDPNELDAKMHSECSMLLPDERVQMGFLCGRDTLILTSHRAMKIDVNGFTGKRVLYLSIPYTRIQSFEVESAGTWDMDAKMQLHIKAPWYAREVGSGLSIDFGKGRADVLAIHKFLAAQVIGGADGSSSIPREVLPAQPEGGVSSFLSWLGDDYKQISAADATQKFQSDPGILLEEETVDLAFKCGRDFMIYTTKRFMKIDTQGFTGKMVSYKSLPYEPLYCYHVTGASAHPFDSDAEVGMYSDAGMWTFDAKKGQADIMAVYAFLNKKCVFDRAAAAAAENAEFN